MAFTKSLLMPVTRCRQNSSPTSFVTEKCLSALLRFLTRESRNEQHFSEFGGKIDPQYQQCAAVRLAANGRFLSSSGPRCSFSLWDCRPLRPLYRQECGLWKFRRFSALYSESKFFHAGLDYSVSCLGSNCFGAFTWFCLSHWDLASLGRSWQLCLTFLIWNCHGHLVRN